MGYWTDLATKTRAPVELSDHPWAGVLRNTTESVKPEVYATLESTGDLDAYLAVKVSEALKQFAEYKKQGMDDDTARSLVMEELLPQEPMPAAEPYELAGGQEDEIAGLLKFLAGRKPPDPETYKMAIQPGTTKVVNGVSYTLNRAHHWVRTDKLTGQDQQMLQSAPPAAPNAGPAKPHS